MTNSDTVGNGLGESKVWMSAPPSVSVIIPTYNRSALLKEALDSVLSQTYGDFEIIVVDDGSTDDTRHVAESFGVNKIRYINQVNSGPAVARNTGIKAARGRYIAFLDSDDLWLPDKLEKQVLALEENPGYSVVYSNQIRIDDNGNLLSYTSEKDKYPSGRIFLEVLLRHAKCNFLQSMLVRRECFDEVGIFDESLKMSIDRDMILRLSKRYAFIGMDEPTFKYRIHSITDRTISKPPELIEKFKMHFLDKLFSTYGKDFDESIKRKVKSYKYLLLGKFYLQDGKFTEARRRFALSIINDPMRFEAYKYLVFGLAGRRGYGAMRFVIDTLKKLKYKK